jgi:membrane protein DedA with SNARE-associated domain
MDAILHFVELHGVSVVLVVVFLDQIGVPIPSIPVLLMLGALAGAGRIDPFAAFAAALAGSVIADIVWFEIGRRRGSRVLSSLCRLSLEPDTCVSQTQSLFARHGVKSLAVAKFVPGFDTVAPPLAGMLGVGLRRFTAWTAVGGALWLLAFGGAGYLLSDRVAEVAAGAERMSGTIGWTAVALFVAWLGWKVAQRQRVLRALRTARVTPDELHAMIVGGADPVVVDARHAAALELLPFVIPGARLMQFEEIDARHGEIPRDRDVVVYCS